MATALTLVFSVSFCVLLGRVFDRLGDVWKAGAVLVGGVAMAALTVVAVTHDDATVAAVCGALAGWFIPAGIFMLLTLPDR